MWQVRDIVVVNLFLSWRPRHTDHPRSRSFTLRFLNDNHLPLVRSARMAQAVTTPRRLLLTRTARGTRSFGVRHGFQSQANVTVAEPANQPQAISAPLSPEIYDAGVTRTSQATQAPVVAPEPAEPEMNAAPAPEAPEPQVAQQDTQPAAGQAGTPETVAPPAPPPADTATQTVDEAEGEAEVVAASAPVPNQAEPEPGDGDAAETEAV